MVDQGETCDVVFLLGAGASKAAGVPDTFGFVEEFRAFLTDEPDDLRLLDSALSRLREWRGDDVDIELLLETLTRIAERASDPGIAFCRDSASADPALEAAAGRLADRLRDCIKRRIYVDRGRVAYLAPLERFVAQFGRIDIATLNYDTSIEEFAAVHRLPLCDGFREEWTPADLENARTGVRLYKLHGSATWYQTEEGRYVKDRARVTNSQIDVVQAGRADSLMLYPTRKWAYSEPMVGLLFQFKRIVEAPSTRILVIVGYSFRDHHVQGVIRDAAWNNPSLELVVVDPRAFEIRDGLFAQDAAVRWPGHIHARVLCLPYRFEAALEVLKNETLANLRSAAKLERAGDVENARGSSKSRHWIAAAGHFAQCGHVDRFGACRVRDMQLVMMDDRTDLIDELTAAIPLLFQSAPDDRAATAAKFSALILRFLSERLFAQVHGDDARPYVSTYVRERATHAIGELGQFAKRLSGVRMNVYVARGMALRGVGEAASEVEERIEALCERLTRCASAGAEVQPWIETIRCSGPARVRALDALARLRESGTVGVDERRVELTRALSEALTDAVCGPTMGA